MSKGLGRNTRYSKEGRAKSKSKKYRTGGGLEIGKETKSYKEYAKKMYGGGLMREKIFEEPAGLTGRANRRPIANTSETLSSALGSRFAPRRRVTIPEIKLSNVPGGMKKGGRTKKKS
jgi:hypothetical protein